MKLSEYVVDLGLLEEDDEGDPEVRYLWKTIKHKTDKVTHKRRIHDRDKSDKKVDLGLLEEDDEFVEFTVDSRFSQSCRGG